MPRLWTSASAMHCITERQMAVDTGQTGWGISELHHAEALSFFGLCCISNYAYACHTEWNNYLWKVGGQVIIA